MNENKRFLTNYLGRCALLAYFLTPVVPQESWVWITLIIGALVLILAALVLCIIWSKGKMNTILETVTGDKRMNVDDALILFVGVVTFYVAGNTGMSALWLSLLVLDILSLFLPNSGSRKNKTETSK